MSDQQSVVSEALLGTIMNLTGYNADQLQIFFRFLTQISENPLQIADTKANAMPGSQRLEERSEDSKEVNNTKEKNVPGSGPEEVAETNKSQEG